MAFSCLAAAAALRSLSMHTHVRLQTAVKGWDFLSSERRRCFCFARTPAATSYESPAREEDFSTAGEIRVPSSEVVVETAAQDDKEVPNSRRPRCFVPLFWAGPSAAVAAAAAAAPVAGRDARDSQGTPRPPRTRSGPRNGSCSTWNDGSGSSGSTLLSVAMAAVAAVAPAAAAVGGIGSVGSSLPWPSGSKEPPFFCCFCLRLVSPPKATNRL